jgi:hypothetical protein
MLGIVLTAMTHTALAGEPVDAKALYADSSDKGSLQTVSQAEMDRMEKLFTLMFQGNVNATVRTEWQELGFTMVDAVCAGVPCVVLAESKGQKRGRGFYLFSRDQAGPVIMMPHRYYDLDTGKIGMDMFATGLCRAAAWNTVHRYAFERQNKGDPSDLADNVTSPFAAFTRSFARVHPQKLLVQVHGFSHTGRKTRAGREAGIILSGGGRVPVWLVPLGRDLKRYLDVDVRIYPLDVNELGGTTNVSGRILSGLGHSGFVHLEMERTLRSRLKDEASLCLRLTTILGEIRP